jgi:GMP synthase (glutamine-hydrolysing)
MLLIIDNQSQYLRKFKRSYLDEFDISHMIVEHNEQIDFQRLPSISGLMISGGKGNPYEPLNLTTNYVALMNLDVPTIGVCLGHEIIAVAYQSKIRRMHDYQAKKQRVIIQDFDDPLFEGLAERELMMQKKHRFHVPNPSQAFEVLAHSDVCPNEVMRHREKPIYGFQGHPEVSGNEGLRIMTNFLKLCGFADPDDY